jgi:hypothetical protein
MTRLREPANRLLRITYERPDAGEFPRAAVTFAQDLCSGAVASTPSALAAGPCPWFRPHHRAGVPAIGHSQAVPSTSSPRLPSGCGKHDCPRCSRRMPRRLTVLTASGGMRYDGLPDRPADPRAALEGSITLVTERVPNRDGVALLNDTQVVAARGRQAAASPSASALKSQRSGSAMPRLCSAISLRQALAALVDELL